MHVSQLRSAGVDVNFRGTFAAYAEDRVYSVGQYRFNNGA